MTLNKHVLQDETMWKVCEQGGASKTWSGNEGGPQIIMNFEGMRKFKL